MGGRIAEDAFDNIMIRSAVERMSGDQVAIRMEAVRARASEIEQDATIKALADALERCIGHVPDGDYVVRHDASAALCRAKRLK